jgi:muramidase (phage lysozyme)
MPRITANEAGGPNVCAFLDCLAWSEIGPRLLKQSDDGYNVLVGGNLFASYADHPNVYNRSLNSTAAGRYQLLYRWWVPYQKLLHLRDFSPLSQDRVAVRQIMEQRAIGPLKAGNVDLAVRLCRNIWASLPGAGYGQHENTLDDLRAIYVAAGGTFGDDGD